MNPLTFLTSDGLFVEGQIICPYSYCKSHYTSGKCKKFYEELLSSDEDNFYICPHGLSVYKVTIQEKKFVFTSLKIKDMFNRAKINFIEDTEDRKMFSPVLIKEYVKGLVSTMISSGELTELDSYSVKNAVISNISHEVNKLISQIKELSESILSCYHFEDDEVELSKDDIRAILQDIRSIYLSSCMATSRFMLYDYENHPATYLRGEPFECNVYKKFDKIRKIFKNYRKKGVKIFLNGNCHRVFEAYPSFEMVPVLIIENAVKYSDAGDEVVVSFIERGDDLTVKVESNGPFVENAEMAHIFEKGYRGSYAKKMTDGSGIGLYFVKKICEMHKIEITAISDSKKRMQRHNIKYAPFIITLNIHNTSADKGW